ncbi:MAG: Gfo/Idh/MocA family oxidoreductase [Armatimonadota bacterium]|jgi:predicted dehydrogenase
MAGHRGKLGVAIVGTGGIAVNTHMPGWQALKGQKVEMVASCDVVEERAQEAAAKFDVPHVFTDYRKVLKMDEVDIVDVCTPNKFHKPITVAALKAGKHVIVEKPIAMTAAEARAMCRAAKKARKKLMVAQSMRYSAESQAMKQFADSGAMGRAYYGHATMLRRRGIPGWGVFTNKELQGGGPLIDIGVHVLDLTLWLMGFPEPATVSGVTFQELGTRKGIGGMGAWDYRNYTVEDHCAALIRFKNGASVMLEASFALNIPENNMNQVFVCGTKGGVSNSPLTFIREELGNLTASQPQYLPKVQSHAAEIADFVQCIRKGTPSPVPGEQALITQRILNAIYQSAEEGAEVKVR